MHRAEPEETREPSLRGVTRRIIRQIIMIQPASGRFDEASRK